MSALSHYSLFSPCLPSLWEGFVITLKSKFWYWCQNSPQLFFFLRDPDSIFCRLDSKKIMLNLGWHLLGIWRYILQCVHYIFYYVKKKKKAEKKPPAKPKTVPWVLALHCGSLHKPVMAAVCSRGFGRISSSFLRASVVHRADSVSYLLGFRRAYCSRGTGLRSRLLSVRPGGGRLFGCALLLGGGLGWYQTMKVSVQQLMAEEDKKVSWLTKLPQLSSTLTNMSADQVQLTRLSKVPQWSSGQFWNLADEEHLH